MYSFFQSIESMPKTHTRTPQTASMQRAQNWKNRCCALPLRSNGNAHRVAAMRVTVIRPQVVTLTAERKLLNILDVVHLENPWEDAPAQSSAVASSAWRSAFELKEPSLIITRGMWPRRAPSQHLQEYLNSPQQRFFSCAFQQPSRARAIPLRGRRDSEVSLAGRT